MEKATILVVDDEREIRELLKDFLEENGYRVLTCSGGTEAFSALRTHRPQLILLDVMMPEMSGLATLQRIRAIDPTVGIIMLTGVGDEGVAKEALSRGAYDYLTKPVDFKYLEFAILTQLAQRDGSRAEQLEARD